MYTRDSGSMIRQKAKEFTSTRMVHHILGSGIMTSNTDMATKSGQMGHSMKVTIFKE
jgi:hypothetical protein